MIELKHGDLIRFPRWDAMSYASIGTTRGYYAELRRSGENVTLCGDAEVWTVYAGSAIVDDGGAYYRRERERASHAITVNAGDTVRVEGREYIVRPVRGSDGPSPRFSDPIHFEPAEAR
jgi:hypothetical protein